MHLLGRPLMTLAPYLGELSRQDKRSDFLELTSSLNQLAHRRKVELKQNANEFSNFLNLPYAIRARNALFSLGVLEAFTFLTA